MVLIDLSFPQLIPVSAVRSWGQRKEEKEEGRKGGRKKRRKEEKEEGRKGGRKERRKEESNVFNYLSAGNSPAIYTGKGVESNGRMVRQSRKGQAITGKAEGVVCRSHDHAN
jgi:hypothetical protein